MIHWRGDSHVCAFSSGDLIEPYDILHDFKTSHLGLQTAYDEIEKETLKAAGYAFKGSLNSYISAGIFHCIKISLLLCRYYAQGG
jgi:hypothetical protein